MNRPIAHAERATPWWLAAALVLGLAVGPLLVPLVGPLPATDGAMAVPTVTAWMSDAPAVDLPAGSVADASAPLCPATGDPVVGRDGAVSGAMRCRGRR